MKKDNKMNKDKKKISLKKWVVNFLKNHPNEMYTLRDIATQYSKENPKYWEEKAHKSKENRLKTEEDVITQWTAEISARKSDLTNTPGIVSYSKQFYYDGEHQEENHHIEDKQECCVKEDQEDNQKEKDLYPILSKFCENELGVKCYRIDEKRSTKEGKGHNKWLFADVVGFHDLTSGFKLDIVKKTLNSFAGERAVLYSFEVKTLIKRSELRKYFFQAVSNSSWANYSYLVAEGIDDDAKDELELLCSSFKIGFIKLSRKQDENGRFGEVVIPAEKKSIDWNMVNRIATENLDFRTYLELVSCEFGDETSKKLVKEKWGI